MASHYLSEEDLIIRRKCCSVRMCCYSSCCWAILSIVMSFIGFSGIFLNSYGLEIFPPETYFVFSAFGIYSILVIVLGILGVCKRAERYFIVFIVLTSVGLFLQMCSFALLLLYSVDLIAIKTADSQLLNARSRLVNHLESLSEDSIGWNDTQNMFGCCGIAFEVGLDVLQTSDGVEELAFLESGEACFEDGIHEEVVFVRTAILQGGSDVDLTTDEYGNIISLIDNENFGLETGYFCVSRLSQLMSQYFPLVIAIILIYLTVQCSTIVSASRMYWVPEFLGGWKVEKDALSTVAEHAGIKI